MMFNTIRRVTIKYFLVSLWTKDVLINILTKKCYSLVIDIHITEHLLGNTLTAAATMTRGGSNHLQVPNCYRKLFFSRFACAVFMFWQDEDKKGDQNQQARNLLQK